MSSVVASERRERMGLMSTSTALTSSILLTRKSGILWTSLSRWMISSTARLQTSTVNSSTSRSTWIPLWTCGESAILKWQRRRFSLRLKRAESKSRKTWKSRRFPWSEQISMKHWSKGIPKNSGEDHAKSSPKRSSSVSRSVSRSTTITSTTPIRVFQKRDTLPWSRSS